MYSLQKRTYIGLVLLALFLTSFAPVTATNHGAFNIFDDDGPGGLILSIFALEMFDDDLGGDDVKKVALIRFVLWIALLVVIKEVLTRWVFMNAQKGKGMFANQSAGVVGFAIATMTIIVIPNDIIIMIASAYGVFVVWMLFFLLILLILIITFKMDIGGESQPWLTALFRFLMLTGLYLFLSIFDGDLLVDPGDMISLGKNAILFIPIATLQRGPK